jgi:hypothetical protein
VEGEAAAVDGGERLGGDEHRDRVAGDRRRPVIDPVGVEGVVVAGDAGRVDGAREEPGGRDHPAPPPARGRGAQEAGRGAEAEEDELEEVVGDVVHARRPGGGLRLFLQCPLALGGLVAVPTPATALGV